MVRLSIARASPDRAKATPRAMPRRSAAAQVQERSSAHLPEVVKARPLERLRAQARELELPPPPASRKSGSRRRVYSPLRSRDQGNLSGSEKSCHDQKIFRVLYFDLIWEFR